MKTRITARLIEGGTLDKLADGRMLDLDGKIVIAKKGGKKVSLIKCDKEPGFYLRLNAKTYRHAFGVVTPMRDGVKGENMIIGKLDEFADDDGVVRERGVKDARAKCRDFYKHGTAQASNEYSLDFCFAEWLADNPKRSERTIAGVRRDLELFSADWRERSVSDIETQEILKRAASIRDGNITSPNSEKTIGTYNVARRWLLSMSAIHNAARLYHESFNGFEAVLAKYKKQDGLQRAFTSDEIKTVIGFEEKDIPRGPDMKPCPHKWLRMLSLKFQLFAGFRIGDVVALRVDEIKQDDGFDYIEHINSKGKRPHFLPIPSELKTILDLAEQARQSNPSMMASEFVFCSSTGSRFSNPRDSFDVARDILTGLELISPEKVPGNGARLIRSHDCRRTFRTTCIDDLGIAESTVNALLDHGESAMNKVYRLPSHEQRMTALGRLLDDHAQYCKHLAALGDAS